MDERQPPANAYEAIHVGGDDTYAKAWIQHRILTIIWEKDDGGAAIKGLRFRVRSPNATSKPKKNTQVEPYVKGLINGLVEPELGNDTPWDIQMEDMEPGEPNHPRILLLELDKEINWFFTKGGEGVTAKARQTAVEDTNRCFFDREGNIQPAGEGAPEACRFLCWSILSRPRDASGKAQLRGFNFHITMTDPETGKSMPTIFDPNVPNNGGTGIP